MKYTEIMIKWYEKPLAGITSATFTTGLSVPGPIAAESEGSQNLDIFRLLGEKQKKGFLMGPDCVCCCCCS